MYWSHVWTFLWLDCRGYRTVFCTKCVIGLVILVICFLIWQLFFLIWPLIALSMFSKSALSVFWQIYWWQKMWPTQRGRLWKNCAKVNRFWGQVFWNGFLVCCQNIAGLLNLSTSYVTCSQIWLIHLILWMIMGMATSQHWKEKMLGKHNFKWSNLSEHCCL
jgi:hypothetical protein